MLKVNSLIKRNSIEIRIRIIKIIVYCKCNFFFFLTTYYNQFSLRILNNVCMIQWHGE